MDAPILISPYWDIKCHVHTNTSNLAIKVMLAQNLTGKYDQLIAYALRLFNNTKQNYTTTKREALAMVYAFHKFRHYLLGNKFIFYVDHMALLYLVQNPQILGRITSGYFFFWSTIFQLFINQGHLTFQQMHYPRCPISQKQVEC